jgi:hypothetical protein
MVHEILTCGYGAIHKDRQPAKLQFFGEGLGDGFVLTRVRDENAIHERAP